MEGVISMDTHEVESTTENNKADGGTASTKSYRGAVVGVDGIGDGEEKLFGSDSDYDNEDVEEIDIDGIRVEDQKIGNYDCPIFVLSKAEEKRIHRPWKRGVIVKLLGRRIGYKALETRLKQMWVKKGIINIIDLGNDYYLVTFSHDLDHATALTNGPWFIYDHYLTVKEWSPNFHPQSDTIKKVAVWVRISGLPIEYYDARVLRNIGNKIGSTMKVDKNTLMQERGKYARLCVEVDLTKSLLAMFMIKGRKYNVEYEGLHLLCKNCGRFGHYSEGCPEKTKAVAVNSDDGKDNGGRVIGGKVLPGSNVDGPWMVVQKQKRNRKSKEKEATVPTMTEGGGKKGPARFNAAGKINGSRFGALMEENGEDLQENIIIEGQDVEPMVEGHVAQGEENGGGIKEHIYDAMIGEQKGGAGKRKNKSIIIANKVIDVDCYTKEDNGVISCHPRSNSQEKNTRISNLGARLTSNFKGRPNSKGSGRASLDNIVENFEKNKLAGIFKEQFNPEREKRDGEMKFNGPSNPIRDSSSQDLGLPFGLSMSGPPNAPRPPDLQNNLLITSSTPISNNKEDSNLEKDNFLDASDQVGEGSSDSDMEVVNETLPGDQ
ncbi:zinc ion binding / nucleic acid binding protein [Trifolium repens]|nr:zinc ion binding / nucleic acid binding protein [Trifolium repens]